MVDIGDQKFSLSGYKRYVCPSTYSKDSSLTIRTSFLTLIECRIGIFVIFSVENGSQWSRVYYYSVDGRLVFGGKK